MELTGDLAHEELARALPERPLRSYPALLSTEADAQAWARAGAPEGAVVVADYQVSPRGRAGWSWEVAPGVGLGFALVLRPGWPVEREGWAYAVAVSGVADAAGDGAEIEWPDQVRRDGAAAGAVGVTAELGPDGVVWAVVNLVVPGTPPPRAPVLAQVVGAVEARYRQDPEAVLADLRPRCATLGRRVRARLIPVGPAGPRIEGRAADVLADGALVVETERGSRVAVRPQNLGVLEDAP
ncbi:MAG: biotin--[acetyl-CoA-carboxylase] ligase [Acidimicrobiales bacterium]